MWLGHHFQGQKVNGQLAGGVAPPTQLVHINFDRSTVEMANNLVGKRSL